MNELLENPLQRLLPLVEKIRKIPRTLSVKDGWAKLFDLETKDTTDIFLAVVNLVNLVNEAEFAIRQIQVKDHTPLVRPVKNVLHAVTFMNFDAQWNELASRIDEQTIAGLEICNQFLSSSLKDNFIDNDTLKNLTTDIDSLREKLMESQLPDELKHFFVEQLEKLRNAILNYRIFGASYLKNMVADVLGTTLLYREEIVMNQDKDKAIVDWFFRQLSRVADLFAITEGVPRLFEGLKNLLG